MATLAGCFAIGCGVLSCGVTIVYMIINGTAAL